MKYHLLPAVIATMIAAPAFASPLVTTRIDDQQRATLAGNHASAIAMAQDKGAIAATHPFQHVLLQLKRSPQSQQALDALVAAQQVHSNALFHHWLTSADLRAYGPDQADIDRLSTWLQGHGVAVNSISPSGMTVDITGTAAALSAAFGTAIHSYTLRGETHFANIKDASVPAALLPLVQGVMLSNFFPKPNIVRPAPSFTIPTGTGNVPIYAVAPADFNTIYNVTPMLSGQNGYNKIINGAGVTVAVIEDSDMQPKDWNSFRNSFGLNGYPAHLISLHPGKCTPGGLNADEVEAALDTEWVSAAAPDANVVEASCATTETTFGVQTALSALVEGTQTDATIYSISYGGCEQENGLSFLQQWANLTEEAAAEGISVLVSSGDSGASCDRDAIAQNGLGVNGLAANPYVLSVGGTDFQDASLNQLHHYWADKNSPYNGHSSVLSYVPEIPWNDSCASSILAAYEGSSSAYAYCNGPQVGIPGVGGSGGASLYYSKPAWQSTSLLGMPKDGARDQPDVASFASNGIWDHASLMCFSDQFEGGAPCVYHGTSPNGAPNAYYQLVGGTSVAAPAFAGILALVTEVQGQKLGNPAPRLYALAGLQFTNKLLVKECNASLGKEISAGCVFNNVTQGDIAQPCDIGSLDCHATADSTAGIGILTPHAGNSPTPAYAAQPGYSMATGLGSVNAANLIYSY